MDLKQRIHELETTFDWPALAEALEQAGEQEQDPAKKSAYLLKLGRVLNEKLLQGPRALKYFQNAWKLRPDSTEPLTDARNVYWDLGRVKMVETVLKRTLETAPANEKGSLLLELADVCQDLGNFEAALDLYHQASQTDEASFDAHPCIEDLSIDEPGYADRIDELLGQAVEEPDVNARVRVLLRAARIAKRFGNEQQYEELLLGAYQADPNHRQAAALYENLFAEDPNDAAGSRQRRDLLLSRQQEMMSQAPDDHAALLAFRYGARWVQRQDNEAGAVLLEQALLTAPSNDVAFVYLRELWGTHGGDWSRVEQLAEQAVEQAGGKAPAYLFAEAGRIAWLKLGDLMLAKRWFERLGKTDAAHPALAAFEKQIGGKLGGGDDVVDLDDAESIEAIDDVESVSDAKTADSPKPPSAKAAPPPPPPRNIASSTPDVSVKPQELSNPVETSTPAQPSAPPGPSNPPPVSAPPPKSQRAPVVAGPQDDALIAKLTEEADKQLKAKRNADYVKTLVKIAEAYTDPDKKIEYYEQAADLYQKFSNAAEAVKCFEGILALSPMHRAARDFLRDYYDKRRNWEKLLELMKGEAESLDESERAAKYIEMAQLASDKIKKPEICIEMWNRVREFDPGNVDALNALATFYERAKEFEPLAAVLTELVDAIVDPKEQLNQLVKLAQIQGDRLNNDAASADAWQRVLMLAPDDRRAQENLKKKLLTLQRWDDLEVLYEESGKWDELIRSLEQQEGKEKDNPIKIGLLMKIADLWLHKKEKADKAAKAYEKILTLDEQHLAAAEALIPIYQEAQNAKGLAQAIEVKLLHAEDPEQQYGLLVEVGELYETKLKKPDTALERFLKAFGLGREWAAADSAERVSGAINGWEQVIAAYQTSLDGLADADLEAQLRLRLGRVLLDEVKRIDDALGQYRAVYELDPNNGQALEALERLYRETNRHSELLEVYEKQRELADTTEAQCRVLYGIASLQETEIGQPEKAIDTYLQVLEIEAADARALEALDRLYLGQKQWDPYADILRRRLDTDVDEKQIVDLKYRLGQTLEKHLGDPQGALDCYREILLLDPDSDAARVALEGLLENAELAAEVARILSDVYETHEQWNPLIGVLEILATAEADAAKRVALLRKIAGVCHNELKDVARAFDAEARALVDMPDSEEVRGELEGLAEAGNDWAGLAKVYAGIAGGLDEPALAREYWMRLASIQEHLGQIDEAAQSYGRVLDIDPADGAALASMEDLFTRTERWSDLIGAIRRRIDLAQDDGEREKLFAQIAGVFDEKLAKPEEAIAAYVEVLGFNEASLTALRALDDLYNRQGQYQELGDNLERQLRLAESEDAEIGLMLRLAGLQQAKLGLTPAAIETYRQVLERQPQNKNALAALEELGKSPDNEIEIAEILGPLYREAGDYPKLLGVYEVQVRRAEDPARAVELLHEMGDLHEDAGGDLSAAFDTLARALAIEPGSQTTQDGLMRLAGATDRYRDLAKVYEELAATQASGSSPDGSSQGQDVELAISLYTMSASIYLHQINAVENAIGHYRKILELDATHLASVEALEGIFRQTEGWQELSAVLQQKAGLLGDVDQQKSSLMQAAQIEEEILEQLDAAVAVFQKVLEIDAEDLRALDALIRLYLGMQKWQELLGAYNKKVDLVYDPEERKRIYYQAGAVWERELQDVRHAIDTYQRVLEIDPDDLEALGRLDALYQQAEDWPELLNVLQREADLAADPAESISYQYRIAELYDRRLEDVARAIELYRELLSQQPDHAPTLAALEALTKGAREPVAAAQVLEPIYQAMGEWQRLIAALEVQVDKSEDAFQKVELLTRIAGLHEEMLNDPGSAFDTYARAVAIDISNDDVLAQFERLASFVTRWADLAGLYDKQLAALADSDPARFTEIGLRLARIYEEQLENWDAAIERYNMVAARDPENVTAIGSLDRLYQQTERWNELAAILTKEAEMGQGDVLAFRFRLAQVQQFRLNDVASAIATYGQVVSEQPDHQDALTALETMFNAGTEQLRIAAILEPHYEALAQYDYLAGVYEAVLTHKTDPAERLEQYHRLAELQEQRLGQPGASLGIYIRALAEFPIDERVLEELERLAGFVEDGWEHLANAYADVLGQQQEVELQRMLGKRLARVFEEELHDVQKAEETYTYVLSVAALDVECLENLDRIYTALSQPAQLAGVLEQRVQTVQEPYQLIELYGRLGEIYEQQLAPQDARHYDDAVRVYRKIFDELEPSNETAQIVLERVYGLQQKWQELYAVYERQLAGVDGDFEKGEISAKMARVLASHLGDVPRAIDTWKRVLDLKGEDGEALSGLAELYEQTQQWAELTEVLERHLATVTDEKEHVAVLLRRGRLHLNQLRRDDLALDDYVRVLDIDFANLESLYAINDIWRKRYNGELPHETRGNTAELLLALHQTADRAAQSLPAEHQVALYREMALLHQQDPEQKAEAVDAWRKLLEVDPRDFDAMGQLETILRSDERWNEVVDVKMMRARAYDDPQEKVREYLEVAHVWEHQIGSEDGGTPALEAVLGIVPAHDDAFQQLEKLHKAAERWEPLIELYLARVETRDEVGERTALLRKVAKIFDEQLHEPVQAYESLEAAFELDFTDDETVAYLEKMTAATKRWGGLLQTVNGLLEQATDPRIQVILNLRMAKWYGEDLDRQDYAQPCYARVAQLDPNNVQARRQMAAYKKKQLDWRGAGQLLEEAQQLATRDADRAAILTDIGELLEKFAGQPEQAVARYQRAIEADASYLPPIEALERLYESRNMTAELVGMLERKAKALKDPERIAEVKLRTAAMLEGTLANPEKAITVYRGVLEVEAGNLPAIRGLERVYTATQKWPEMLEVLEMHLDVAATERERADVLLRIAGLQEEEFRKPDLAAVRLEQVVEIDPTNQAAFEQLARCYQKQQQWHELISCLERFINIVDDRQKKIQLYTQVAQIHADQLQDHEKALDAYLAIVDLDPQAVFALEALAKLYERMDDPASAIEYMTRVAELTTDGGQKVEAYYRIGKQLEDKLSDRGQARAKFEQALDLNPYHLPTLAAMRAVAIDEADWYSATRYLETEQQFTESPRLKAKLLVELGRIRNDMQEQPDLAVQAYQSAHQADPDNEEAALPLARFYVQQGKFAEAEPLTELLEKKASTKEREQQIELFMLHGKVEMSLGKGQEALRAYTSANKVDLTNREAIRGLADANFLLKDWPGALSNYQRVLTALGDDEPEQRAEVLYRLGCVKKEQGQVKQAINNFEKAIGLEPSHRPTLEALASTYESLNDWAQSCAYRQVILDNVIDGEERYKLLVELSDIWADKVGDPVQALNALEQAADLHPEDHQLQHKLLALYQKTSRWEKVVSTLQRIAEGDPNPQRRARYLFTMAQVYRDKLEDVYQAVALFEEALDLNPEYIDAFQRIDKLLTQANDFAKLERSYRKMIFRVAGKGNAQLEYSLWHALGLIYRDKIRDFTKATEAFSAALGVKPDAVEERVILAELAAHVGDASKALEQYRSLLERDAMNTDAYRSIYTIYLQQQAYDEAWCVASVLAFAGRANEEEQRFFEDWRPQDIPQVAGALDASVWQKHLFHKDEDVYIGKIFEAVALASLKAKIADATAKNQRPVLPDNMRQDPQTSTGTFPRTFWWAAKALAITTAPQLYARTDQPGGLVAVANIPPASVAGQAVLQGLSPLERAFVCGKHLAMYRGEHYIKTLFPTVTELTVLLFGAVSLVAQLPAPPEYANQVKATATVLNQYIEPIQREALKVAVNQFMKAGARANIKRWAQAVETTAARAGLLLAGDLNVAKKIIMNEQQIPGDLSPGERLKELMIYSVSEDHMKLRKALGISIRPEG